MPNHSFCTTSGSSVTGLGGGVPSGGHDTPQYMSTSRTISKAHAPTNMPSARLSSITCDSRGRSTAHRGAAEPRRLWGTLYRGRPKSQ